jgi:hypothetical protein
MRLMMEDGRPLDGETHLATLRGAFEIGRLVKLVVDSRELLGECIAVPRSRRRIRLRLAEVSRSEGDG